MTKKGKLSAEDIKYIEKNHTKLSSEQIATKLDRTIKTISKYIPKVEEPEEPEEESETPEVPQKINALDYMGVRKGRAVVMTETASMMGDKSRKSGPTISDKYAHCIRPIKDD